MSTDADVEALKYGVQRFPALRRVTITPAAYGSLFMLLYEIPMIRALPSNFNYPIPHTWPLELNEQKTWESSSEAEKDTWRGFRAVTRTLAAAANLEGNLTYSVTDLIVDVNNLLTGLNAHIFNEECVEQRDLVTLLRRTNPNFRRLDLVLGVGCLEHSGWRAFRSGCLRRTLTEAPALDHISLKTDMADMPDPNWMGMPAGDHHFIPLRDIFPVDIWKNLRHFGLSRFAVRQNDLLLFLQALPATLRSVELSILFFLEGNY